LTKYEFRREDNDEIVEVDFTDMMSAKDGFLEIEPGVWAKRINRTSVKKQDRREERKEIVSDALGFGVGQLAEMEADRKANGHYGIEFRPDPDVPEFIQVHCCSERSKNRYMEHRNFSDQNSRNGSGNILSERLIEDAKELIMRKEQTDGKD
jgi:hypothetical protein